MIIWIPVALTGALLVAGIAGLIVAATLGAIARRVSELDADLWSSMPVGAHEKLSDAA